MDIAAGEINLEIVDPGTGPPGEDATLLRIDSSRGTVFKNNAVETVMSVSIFRGSLRITDSNALAAEFGAGAYLQWYYKRMSDDDFILIATTDERLADGGFSFYLSPEDVDTKCVFMCELITEE